jgi:two-component system response regulator DesR
MIRVLVAEDMHIVRGALVALLCLEPDIEVVAEVASGPEILPAARRAAVDVAIIDIDLPGKDGLTVASELHEQLPGCRTVILTSLGRPGTLRRALDAKVSVLRMTAEGFGTVEVAARLYLSAGTVRNYLTTVVTKLRARNRVDAIRIARESGWL